MLLLLLCFPMEPGAAVCSCVQPCAAVCSPVQLCAVQEYACPFHGTAKELQSHQRKNHSSSLSLPHM